MRKYFPCLGGDNPPPPDPPDPPDPPQQQHPQHPQHPLSLSSSPLSLSPPTLSLYTSLPPTQEMPSDILCEATVSPMPSSANLDDLTSQLSEISLSLDMEKAERQRNELRMTVFMQEMFSEMSAGMNELKEEVRDLKDQQHSYIARLASRNSQLCDEKSQWLLQQRSSGATRLLGRSTASLPSFITPVKSSSPIVDVSRGDLDEPLTPPKKWTRGGDLRSTEQCKKPVRLW